MPQKPAGHEKREAQAPPLRIRIVGWKSIVALAALFPFLGFCFLFRQPLLFGLLHSLLLGVEGIHLLVVIVDRDVSLAGFDRAFDRRAGADRQRLLVRGNRRIELAPKKPTIEVGVIEKLVPTLTTLRDAVLAGELDKALAQAKPVRKLSKS